MPIAVFFLIFAGSIAIALLYPHLRAIAAAIAIGCGAVLAYVAYDRLIATDTALPRIAAEEVELGGLLLEQGARLTRLTGRATNHSPTERLADLTLRVTLHDCPAPDSPRADCAVIGQDEGIARLDLPPGQTRAFHVVLRFTGMPEPRGVLVWDSEIASVRAARAPLP